MKNIIIFIVLIIFSSCNRTEQNEKLTYKRIALQGNENFYGFVSSKGDTIIPLGKFDFLDSLDIKGMIRTHNKGKEGFIDINQNIIIPFEYYEVGSFSENLAFVAKEKKGKYGYVNRKGKLVIGYQFDVPSWFYKNGLASVGVNDKYGFINKQGEVIIPIEYDYVISTKFDDFVVVSKNKKCAFLTKNGGKITEFEYDKIYRNFYKGSQSTVSNGLMLVEKNGEFAYFNKNIEEIIPFGKYETAETFDNNRMAIVGNKNKYGLINENGELITPIEFDYISKFIDGVYHFEKESKEGILNKEGKVISTSQFR